MRRIFIVIVFVFISLKLSSQEKVKFSREIGLEKLSQEDTWTNEYLDTLNLKRKLDINDYTMIGIHYGVGLSQVI